MDKLVSIHENIFDLAHCMLCSTTENLKVIGHHKNDFIIGFFFVCSNCIEIVRNAEVKWELITTSSIPH